MAVGFDLGLANIQTIADEVGVIEIDQPGPGGIALGGKARIAIPLSGLPKGDRLRLRWCPHGQIQGGVVQGIGWALNEEYFYDDKGVMRNSSYLDYRIPTCYDVPMIETLIVEVPDPEHPFGVRGVGEVPIVPPPAAVANAIANAVGVRMEKLPMSPPNLLKEILAKK